MPATLAGQDVVLDRAGRVTTVKGTDFSWTSSGILRSAGGIRSVRQHGTTYLDGQRRRVLPLLGSEPPRAARAAALCRAAGTHPRELPLRGDRSPSSHRILQRFDVGPKGQPRWTQRPELLAYYEVDLTGNVRRLGAAGGRDLGGYRYSAFGKTIEDIVVNEDAAKQKDFDLTKQPFRWKGHPHEVFGSVELYDMRARWWVPEMGAFLSIDEYVFHDVNGTLWSWLNENPIRHWDPSGHLGIGDSPSTDRVIGANANWNDPNFQQGYNAVANQQRSTKGLRRPLLRARFSLRRSHRLLSLGGLPVRQQPRSWRGLKTRRTSVRT